MNSLIIVSTPAGGKGTVSDYIKDKYNYDHISVGDLFRDEVENDTEIGQKIKNKLKNGLLVDDDILFPLLEKRLKQQKHDFILDGTPRELHQAERFDKLLESLNINLSKVIYIKTDKEVAKERMLNRVVCEDCNDTYKESDGLKNCPKCGKELTRRNDDNLNTFEKRCNTFVTKTLPVVKHYEEKNILFTITNNTDISDVFKQIDKIM